MVPEREGASLDLGRESIPVVDVQYTGPSRDLLGVSMEEDVNILPDEM